MAHLQVLETPVIRSRRELAEYSQHFLKRVVTNVSCRLLKGEQIKIFTGKLPNAEFLFTAPARLLIKFSKKWNRELTNKNIKALYVFAHKEAVKLVIEWMAGGGMDNARGAIPCPKNDILKLLSLNKLVVDLEITNLTDRTLRDIGALSLHGSLSSDQIARAFAIAQPFSQARTILERNLTKWVATFNHKDWEVKCQLASNKAALNILANLRATALKARENRKKQIGYDSSRRKKVNKAMTAIRGITVEKPKSAQSVYIKDVASGLRARQELLTRSKREKMKPFPK